MKRILRVLVSRTFAFAILALLQVVLFCAVIFWFANIGAAIYVIFTVISVLVLLAVLEQDELNPAYKLMWTLVIVLMPVFGVLFYLMWGHHSVPQRKRRQLLEIERRNHDAMEQDPRVFLALETADKRLANTARYLVNYAASPLYPSVGNEYYPLGRDFYPRFLEVLKSAQSFIFMEYFIWEEGRMLDEVVAILRQKAAEGVDVRVMWDGFGSMFTLPGNFQKTLRGYGIQCAAFSPLEVTFHISDYAMLNHRDHRKITVVDGHTGFSGGLNIADEYINIKERLGEWKDTSFLLRGPAVYALTTTFLRLWDFATESASDYSRFCPPLLPDALPGEFSLEQGFTQPYWDSPLDNENVSESTYLNVLHSAKNYVYISTPYLILDHEMITSLCLAAKSGVDVRILTPGIPDKPSIFLVTQSYYPTLLAAGVRIYEFTPGFNHAKMYVSDDKIAIVGSANMDYRSLYLHFENCVAFYGGNVVHEAKRDMLESFARSKELALEDTRNIGPFRRLMQVVGRFFAPLM